MGNVNFLLNFLVYLEFYEVDPKSISKIAKLARIKVSDNEAQNLATDLTKIFDWIEQLNKYGFVLDSTLTTEMRQASTMGKKRKHQFINQTGMLFRNEPK